jgi:hypothetical protein
MKIKNHPVPYGSGWFCVPMLRPYAMSDPPSATIIDPVR